MTLLCRTAENLYWMGRHLERAESVTRLVREHTALITDLPISSGVGWDCLLAIPGETELFLQRYDVADEANVMTYLLADHANASSLLSSMSWARENLRTTRATMPRETWRILNELSRYTTESAAQGVSRGGRHEFCERVVGGCQRLSGFLAGSMGRDPAWRFYQLGVQTERADMTSRVLDVRAGALVSLRHAHDGAFADSQWVSLLRSLDGLQLYRRLTRSLVEGDRVVGFVLGEALFPRSIGSCLQTVADLLEDLPHTAGSEQARAAARTARQRLGELPSAGWTPEMIHDEADRIQLSLAALDLVVNAVYFHLEGPLAAAPGAISA